MKLSAKVRLILLVSVAAVSILLLARPDSDRQSIQPVKYTLNWDTGNVQITNDTLYLKTNLEYELELTAARVSLASFELYPCEHEHSLGDLIAPKAAAGHGDEPFNPAKVADIQTLSLIQLDDMSFDRSLDHQTYCKFHQVFGVSGSDENPSFEVAGRYRKPGGRWQAITITSDSAFGKNTVVDFDAPDVATFVVTYNLSSAFDNVDFDAYVSDNDIAKIVFENLITQAALEP